MKGMEGKKGEIDQIPTHPRRRMGLASSFLSERAQIRGGGLIDTHPPHYGLVRVRQEEAYAHHAQVV